MWFSRSIWSMIPKMSPAITFISTFSTAFRPPKYLHKPLIQESVRFCQSYQNLSCLLHLRSLFLGPSFFWISPPAKWNQMPHKSLRTYPHHQDDDNCIDHISPVLQEAQGLSQDCNNRGTRIGPSRVPLASDHNHGQYIKTCICRKL